LQQEIASHHCRTVKRIPALDSRGGAMPHLSKESASGHFFHGGGQCFEFIFSALTLGWVLID